MMETSTEINPAINAEIQADHAYFLELASQRALANVDTGKGGPFGCVIVQDGRIIASTENHVHGNCDPTAHAEVEAIREAARNLSRPDLSDCIMYTSAEPCPMCMAAIYWARIPAFYYGNTKEQSAEIGFDDAFFYEDMKKPIQERTVQAIHLPSDTARASFEAWDAFTGKLMY